MLNSLLSRIVAVRAELSELDTTIAELKADLAELKEAKKIGMAHDGQIMHQNDRILSRSLMRKNVAKDLFALECKLEATI